MRHIINKYIHRLKSKFLFRTIEGAEIDAQYTAPKSHNKNFLRTPLQKEFEGLFGSRCLQALLDNFEFHTVLDIGSGAGEHSAILSNHGKDVTSIDIGKSLYAQKNRDSFSYIHGNYMQKEFEQPFDCIWASHTLEHQPDPHIFLLKLNKDLRQGGILAITVPPLKNEIVGGHVTLWNAGILMYQLVLAGFDCRHAHILKYDYNISVILTKTKITLPELAFDAGDIDLLSKYFPEGLREGFDGDIERLAWEF